MEGRRNGRPALAFYLARRELARRYAGSIAGAAWALVFPAVQVLLYWLVFGLGLKIAGAHAVPIASMLVAGMLPWFAFSEALTTTAVSISGNAALVKRLAFPLELLPISTVMAAGIVHVAVIALGVAALAALGQLPGPQLLLLLYYLPCLGLLSLALGTLLALATAGFRDVAQMVAPVLGLWFWATPIVWPEDRLPLRLAWIADANPAYYIVRGYRQALIGPAAPAPGVAEALWFWGVTAVLSALAWLVFRRFKRELADLI